MAHSEPNEDVLAQGSQFGAYTIDACIGQGGMARVYRARHEALQRDVALKVMTLGSADRDGAERFLREARMAAAIKHRNVVNIFDVGLKDGVPFMVMELLIGEDVEARLSKHAPMAEAEIIDMAVPVVAGLSAVHDAGIIHRDLKPGNIFLTCSENGELDAKLLDFGISKSLAHQVAAEGPGAPLMGTPLYMAPEVIVTRELTPQSDQYSLGVVLYECATGENPFLADTMDEVMQKVARGEMMPVLERNPNVSKSLARIIERAMSLDPAERYPDLRAMGRELLILAGQRTRITWGLSFGDVGSSVIPHEVALSDARDEVGLSGLARTARGKRWAAPAGLLATALVVAGVSLGGWPGAGLEVTGRQAAIAASEAPQVELPPAQEPRATVVPAEQPLLAEPPEAEGSDESLSSAPVPAPQPVMPVDKPRARRSAKGGPRVAGGAPVLARSTGDDSSQPVTAGRSGSPEWALAQAPARRHNEVGTNNAPILE